MRRNVVHEFKCQQPLSSFTKTEQGGFCGECKTVVIDLSEKTNSEIIDIIKANNGNVCGSMLKGQLEDSNETTFGFRNKVAVAGLAAILGIGVDFAKAQSGEKVKSEIVDSVLHKAVYIEGSGEDAGVQPAIETPEKPEKKKKERKRKVFLTVGRVSFYTQNLFPFIGARRIVMGRMKW